MNSASIRPFFTHALALGLTLVPAAAHAFPNYAITDLGDLPGGQNFSQASGINNRGQVVGWSGTWSFDRDTETWSVAAQHGFIWDGSLRDLGTGAGFTQLGARPGSPTTALRLLPAPAYTGNSYARGINDNGQVIVDGDHSVLGQVFYLDDEFFGYNTYVWNAGQVTPLRGVQPYAINNSGQLAGSLWNGDNYTASGKAVLWENGATTDLGQLARTGNGIYTIGDSPIRALALNDAGMVAGTSNNVAFAWQAAGLTDLNVPIPAPDSVSLGLPPLPPDVICACGQSGPNVSWSYSAATGINESGEIVGTSSSGGFLWKDGHASYLPKNTGSSLAPTDINNRSQVVGDMSTDAGGGKRAFLWDETNGTVDLNTLLFEPDGWQVLGAGGINDHGWIAATGIKDGVTHALLLKPVPLPPALFSLLSGLFGLGGLAAWTGAQSRKPNVQKASPAGNREQTPS